MPRSGGSKRRAACGAPLDEGQRESRTNPSRGLPGTREVCWKNPSTMSADCFGRQQKRVEVSLLSKHCFIVVDEGSRWRSMRNLRPVARGGRSVGGGGQTCFRRQIVTQRPCFQYFVKFPIQQARLKSTLLEKLLKNYKLTSSGWPQFGNS